MNERHDLAYIYSPDEFFFTIPPDFPDYPAESSKFDQVLFGRWNNAKKAGVFKYELNLLFKSLHGKFGLTAQLNCERARHRRKPHHFKSVRDPFDPRRFNFSKIDDAEILMKLVPQQTLNVEKESNELGHLDASIIVNNSPISAGHSLLIPYCSGPAPQILTLDGLKLAIQVMLLSSCRLFHIVFNSILALASVNHLHLHLYYWPYCTKIIEWPVSTLCAEIYVLKGWIMPGFVIQLQNRDIDSFCSKMYGIVRYFNKSETPHNLFMARAPSLTGLSQPELLDSTSHLYVTCYIFPRKPMYGTKPITNLVPASCELDGHILVYSTWAFQELTEEKVVRIVEEEALLDAGQFEKHCQNISSLFNV